MLADEYSSRRTRAEICRQSTGKHPYSYDRCRLEEMTTRDEVEKSAEAWERRLHRRVKGLPAA